MADTFDPFDHGNQKLLGIAGGDVREAKLLLRALNRGHDKIISNSLSYDNAFTSSLPWSQSSKSGSRYRASQLLADQQLHISPRSLAFSGPPDSVREEHSAFCLLMYQGYQLRFLDKHPGETTEDFVDRPRKVAINITRVIINALSQLYAKRPTRELKDSTPDSVKVALIGDDDAGITGLWSDAYDLELLEADRYTRLEGTISVRPFYDETAPGKIRLWVFHSHQLRVVPDLSKPWQPKAVIERHEPFGARTRIVIWTARTFLTVDEEGVITGEQHGLGKIPHTFFFDRKPSTGSYFVEGRGRGLCDANAVINGKLTDLNEVFQYQGFAVPEVVNSDDDDIVLGPRRPLRFSPTDKNQPFGVSFKQPRSQLAELRADIDADIDTQYRVNGVPIATDGAAISKRSVSGVSIRESMRSLLKDFVERSRVFTPYDLDLVDNCLRMRAEHDDAFSYDPESDKPAYALDFKEPDLPLQIRDQLAKDEFDVAQGAKTPPDLMRRDEPGKWKTDEEAVEKWKSNLDLLNTHPRPAGMVEEVEGEDVNPAAAHAEVEGGPLVGGEMPTWLREEIAAGGNGDSPSPLLDRLLVEDSAGW